MSTNQYQPTYTRTEKTKVRNTRLARKMYPNHEEIDSETINIVEKIEVSRDIYEAIEHIMTEDLTLMGNPKTINLLIDEGIPEKYTHTTVYAQDGEVYVVNIDGEIV